MTVEPETLWELDEDGNAVRAATPAPPALPKRFGGITSREAFASVDVEGRCSEVLHALRRRPEGATASELCELLPHMAMNCIVRRCRDLANRHLVEEAGKRAGASNRKQIVWRAKP